METITVNRDNTHTCSRGVRHRAADTIAAINRTMKEFGVSADEARKRLDEFSQRVNRDINKMIDPRCEQCGFRVRGDAHKLGEYHKRGKGGRCAVGAR